MIRNKLRTNGPKNHINHTQYFVAPPLIASVILGMENRKMFLFSKSGSSLLMILCTKPMLCLNGIVVLKCF